MGLFTFKVDEEDKEECENLSLMRKNALNRTRPKAKKVDEKNLE